MRSRAHLYAWTEMSPIGQLHRKHEKLALPVSGFKINSASSTRGADDKRCTRTMTFELIYIFLKRENRSVSITENACEGLAQFSSILFIYVAPIHNTPHLKRRYKKVSRVDIIIQIGHKTMFYPRKPSRLLQVTDWMSM